LFECLDCGRQTSITAGTAMHRSKLPLTTLGRPSQVVSRVVVYLDGSKPLAKRAFDCAVASERLAVAIGGSRVRVGL
jgi:hypothetical protein